MNCVCSNWRQLPKVCEFTNTKWHQLLCHSECAIGLVWPVSHFVCVNASCLSIWFCVMHSMVYMEKSYLFISNIGACRQTHKHQHDRDCSEKFPFLPSQSTNTPQSCFSSISKFHRKWSFSQRLLLLLSGKNLDFSLFSAFLIES